MEARMERIRQLAATLALALPTGLMVFLSACGGKAAQPVGVTQHAVTIADYGVSSIVPDQNSDLTTVNFSNGVTVAIHFGGFDPGDPDQTASSSDGTSATLSALGGNVIAANWPVITYYDTAGNKTVAGLVSELTASAELDKWAARGNSSALALVAYSFSVGMAAQGVDDLSAFKMSFADATAPAGTVAAKGAHSDQVAQPCPADADNGLPPNLDPDGPDADDCQPLPPARQCLQNVVNTGWYPCVRNVLATLIALIATRWLWRFTCGACLAFLKAALAGGVIFFGSNPVGWLATGGGVLACAVCAGLLYTAITNAFAAIRNCITDRPPPIQCQQP
jgi:hypothetical protein